VGLVVEVDRGVKGVGGEKKDRERVAVGVSICYYYPHGPVFYILFIYDNLHDNTERR
jgi:hypothetical protein